MTKRMAGGLWALAILALGLAAASCSAPAQKQAQQQAGAPAAAADDIGAVKDAFDTDETTGVTAPKTKEELEAARKAYSPLAGKAYPRLALFGDTHNHTANSGDAYMEGTHERDYKRGATLTVEKGVGAKYVELKISDRLRKLQPEFVVRVWE